jgi:CubicO group peptidase (beta-lactamase class C family)
MTFTAEDARRVREAAQGALEELHLPGVGIGVVEGDDLVFSEGFGFADIESGKKQDPALRQRIGSITKTMVGLCAMALVDEGRLSLSDRLVDHIPEVGFNGDGDAGAITVRHILTHTSAIGEVATREEMRDTGPSLWADKPDKDVLGLFPQGITLEIDPGTKWSYANLGFALLGEIVARLEGEPIAQVLQRRVFGPLGMTGADLFDDPHPDLTTPYHPPMTAEAREAAERAGIEVKEEVTVDGYNCRGEYQYIRGGGAAGAVQATVPDMARYASALLRGGAGIVRPETFAAMTAAQWEPDARMESWGLSFQRFERFGRRMYGHGGGVFGGWNTMLLIIPGENLGLIVHANAMSEGVGKLTARVLAALLNEGPVALDGDVPPATLEEAAGVYEAFPGALTNFRIMGSIGRVQLRADDGALWLHARRGPWKPGVRLYPADGADPDHFWLDDNPLEPSRLTLVRGADGAVTGLRCDRLVEMRRTSEVPPWV